MKMLNRKIAPQIKSVSDINFQEPELMHLKNGIPVYLINSGTQDIIKIDLVFRAGSFYQDFPLVASFCNSLLTAGTKRMHANKIAEHLDYYGAILNTTAEKDFACVSLTTLTKHLKKTIPLLEMVTIKADFPERELNILIGTRKQEYLVNSRKVNFIARQKFPRLLFGKVHPYGKYSTVADFDNILRKQIIDFYTRYYSSQNCRIIISGKINKLCLDLVSFYFGKDWKRNFMIHKKEYPVFSSDQKLHVETWEKPLQSAVRIGKILFNKTHPDYMGMEIVNTILGGYFGSRLMANIREDKGYTYGIGSGIISLQQSGFFFISSEVGADVCKKSIDQVMLEIKKLRKENVPSDELNTVKSYMLGMLLRATDGPFALAESFISVNDYGLNMDYYKKFAEVINKATPQYVKELANNYLNEDEMVRLVIGKY